MKCKKPIEVVPDHLNANKHTEFGMRLLEASIRKFGFIEAGVISEDGVICGGNARNEVAEDIGITEKEIIQIDRKRQVYLMPKGLKSGTQEFYELALALNAVPKENISWDQDAIASIQKEWDVKPEEWGVSTEFTPAPPKEPGEGSKSALLIVESDDPDRLNELFYELKDRGFMVQLKEPKDHD